jgi:proline iminopeptidase
MKHKLYIALIPAALLIALMQACETRSMIVPEENTINIGGLDVWYRIVGEGDQTPLVLLHGGPGAPSYYLNPLSELSDGRPVIFFDQPGCGRSDPINDVDALNQEFFVDLLEQFRARLGLEKMILYGQSWGASLALDYYLQHPEKVKAMVLSSPLISTELWLNDTDYLITCLNDSIEQAIRKCEMEGTYDSPEYLHAMQVFYEHFVIRSQPWPPDVDSTFARFGYEVYNHMWGPSEFTATGILREYDRTDVIGQIEVPVLYLTGEFDEARPETVENFHKNTPGSRFVMIKGAGHLTMHDAPGKDAEAIRDFLDEE